MNNPISLNGFEMKKHFILLLGVLIKLTLFSQNIDSLKSLIKPNIPDTEKCNLLIKIGRIYYFNSGQLDTSLFYLQQAKDLSKKTSSIKHQIISLLSNGMVVREKGVYEIATEDYFEALKLAEQINNSNYIANAYSGLAIVYSVKKETSTAREYYNKVIDIYSKNNQTEKLGAINNNIGLSYMTDNNMKMALKYFLKALSIQKNNQDDIGIATASENIGLVYDNFKDYDLALNYYVQALKIWKARNDPYSIAINMGYIAFTLNNSHKYKASIDTAKKALAMAESIGALNTQRDLHGYLYDSYLKIKDFESGLFHFKKKTELNDSLASEDKVRSFTKSELNYVFTKQQLRDSLNHVLEVSKKEEQLKAEKTIKYYAFAAIGIFVLLLFFLQKGYKEKKEANKIILLQKAFVEEKQKEVIDSITYAKRIQTALLASNKLMSENLTEYFVQFKPKDIVAGDFYWGTMVENKFVFVTGDCTGHGVPGAFMSLLNISILSEVIKEKKITSPDQILNTVRSEIIAALNPEGSTEESKDGMDCVVLVIDKAANTLEYASANNSFYLVRNGQMQIYKADKMPVGKSHDNHIPFSNHKLELKKNDIIYTFTDGYADQFGGPEGKKFKYKQLSQLILSIHSLPMSDQLNQLNEAFENWRGKLDQVDDVCIIGIKI